MPLHALSSGCILPCCSSLGLPEMAAHQSDDDRSFKNKEVEGEER